MYVKTFKYKKADGKISERSLLVLQVPGTLIGGYDMSELEATEQAKFAEAVKAAEQEYHEKLNALCQQFDMNYRYRQFKPGNITESTDTSI